jgi:hypothetical protein
MACVNQTRPHYVNKMGKTQSNDLAERHGRGTAGEQQRNGMGTARERHGMCESALNGSHGCATYCHGPLNSNEVGGYVPAFFLLTYKHSGVLCRWRPYDDSNFVTKFNQIRVPWEKAYIVHSAFEGTYRRLYQYSDLRWKITGIRKWNFLYVVLGVPSQQR